MLNLPHVFREYKHFTYITGVRNFDRELTIIKMGSSSTIDLTIASAEGVYA